MNRDTLWISRLPRPVVAAGTAGQHLLAPRQEAAA
jgi:hypothetical protein